MSKSNNLTPEEKARMKKLRERGSVPKEFQIDPTHRMPTQMEALQRVQEVEPDAALRLKRRSKRRYLGQAYSRTGKYFMDHWDVPGIRLVHGRRHVLEKFAAIGHPNGFPYAWVELPGNIVFDGVEQRFFDKDSFYEAFAVRVEASYEKEEAAKHIATTKHWGPWHADAEDEDVA